MPSRTTVNFSRGATPSATRSSRTSGLTAIRRSCAARASARAVGRRPSRTGRSSRAGRGRGRCARRSAAARRRRAARPRGRRRRPWPCACAGCAGAARRIRSREAVRPRRRSRSGEISRWRSGMRHHRRRRAARRRTPSTPRRARARRRRASCRSRAFGARRRGRRRGAPARPCSAARSRAGRRIGRSQRSSKRLDGPAQPFLEADSRLVAECLAGRVDVGPRVADVAGARRCRARCSTGLPRMRPIVSASWLTLAGDPAATLKMRPLAPAASRRAHRRRRRRCRRR